jgi:hypothetical protein
MTAPIPGPSQTIIAAEENVLSAIMVSDAALELIIQTGLDPGDFYRESHAKIYRAGLSLHQTGSPVDALTIARRLEEAGQLADIGGSERLREIAILTTAATTAAAYASIIIRDARRRDYQNFGEQLAESARTDAPLSDLEEQARGFLDTLDQLASTTSAGPPIFEPLRAFLQRQLPKSESLVGVERGGTNLLPRYGWVMPWGREGSAKTSILVDLLFHAASGRDWTGYHVNRPLRFVAIVNEGIPGGLQDKLQQKTQLWEGPLDPVLDNIAIYASPWGEFTFKNRTVTKHARDYALDFGADYVALDPLHTLGTSGAGTPQETEEFKHMLRRFGLWQDLGIITAHHANKNGMVSGDWARHPDTVIRLEKDGKNPATKFTLEKARPADPNELGVPVLLEWISESLGYRRVALDTPEHLSDDDLLERIRDAVTEASTTSAGHISLTDLKQHVKGDSKRISRLARAELDAGRFINRSQRNDWTWLALGDETPSHTQSTIDDAETRTTKDNRLGERSHPVDPGDWVNPDQPDPPRTSQENDWVHRAPSRTQSDEKATQTRMETSKRLGEHPAPSRTQSAPRTDRDYDWVGAPVPLEGAPTQSPSHTNHEETNGTTHDLPAWPDDPAELERLAALAPDDDLPL